MRHFGSSIGVKGGLYENTRRTILGPRITQINAGSQYVHKIKILQEIIKELIMKNRIIKCHWRGSKYWQSYEEKTEKGHKFKFIPRSCRLSNRVGRLELFVGIIFSSIPPTLMWPFFCDHDLGWGFWSWRVLSLHDRSVRRLPKSGGNVFGELTVKSLRAIFIFWPC